MMAELTDQERAVLEAFVHLGFHGGPLSHYVMLHICMGRIAGEIDEISKSIRHSFDGLGDEQVRRHLDVISLLDGFAKAIQDCWPWLNYILSKKTGYSPNDVSAIITKFAGAAGHDTSCTRCNGLGVRNVG